MRLSELDKSKLKNCLKSANNFIIVTTGRAGTDFLQSCYDNHSEVASTSEKSFSLSSFIKNKRQLLPESSEVFAALAVEELIYSFAPYLNKLEDWRISKDDNFRKANISIFLESLNYLLTFEENYKNPLSIARAIILSFSFSLKKEIKNIKTILIHLHQINQLSFYSNYFEPKDLLIVCSRNPYDLIASGVFHRISYWSKSEIYSACLNLSQYKFVMERTLNDYLDVKDNLGSSKIRVRISFLEKLSNINYLNDINNKLLIKPFSKYPSSTVLGIRRRGDLLSNDKSLNPAGTFDPLLVKRGSPIKRLGFIDSILITLMSRNRIIEYGLKTNNYYLNKLIEINIFFRLSIFLFCLAFPSKVEIFYYKNVLKILTKIILSNKLTLRNKFKELLLSAIYILQYPIEYLKIRLSRIKIFLEDSQTPILLNELKNI